MVGHFAAKIGIYQMPSILFPINPLTSFLKLAYNPPS